MHCTFLPFALNVCALFKMACNNIEILAAAWGSENVTAKVWSMVKKDQALQIEATDATFKPKIKSGGEKYLVVCYQYPGENPALLIKKEYETMKIPSQGNPDEQTSKLSSNWQTDILNGAACNSDSASMEAPTILGAAWGGEDVTEYAQKLADDKKLSGRQAINEMWEKPKSKWYQSGKKNLILVYRYSDIPMMSIVKEKETIQLTNSPPLFILGAVYGCEIVTQKVQGFVENHELHFNPRLMLNPALNSKLTYPTFVMAYQFGNEEPILHIGSQSSDVDIFYVQNEMQKTVIVDPNQLVILGAAYGLKDITQKVQKNVLENATLDVPIASNLALGVDDEEWKMYYKILVVIYRYGTGSPRILISKQDEGVMIKKDLPQTTFDAGLVDSRNLVSNTDRISLIAVNKKYVFVDHDTRKLVAGDQNKCCIFSVIQPSFNAPFFLKDKRSELFCQVDDKGFLVLKGDEGKTGFMLLLSMTGKVKLATIDNKFVRLADKQFLKADSTEHLCATTSFEVEVNCSGASHASSDSTEDKKNEIEGKSKNEKMWFEFSWQVVEGFFLALGFEAFLSMTKPTSIELFHLLLGNSNILKALLVLRDEIRSTTNETDAVHSAVCFISTILKEGLLWIVFRFLRLPTESLVYTEIFSQVIQVLQLPASEACVLLSGFSTWASQLIATSKKLQDL